MHTLPALPYDYNALEPHIDAQTMEIHYTKPYGKPLFVVYAVKPFMKGRLIK
jgi:hypothetical protein